MKVNVVIAALCLCTAPGAAAAFQAAQQTPPSRSVTELQATVEKLRTAVQDPLATEATLARARGELQKIEEQLRRQAPASAKDVDVPGPVATAQVEVRRLLTTIEGRLGPAAEPRGPSSRTLVLPVPEFEAGRATHGLANALRAAQLKLADHLRTGDTAPDELIADIVVEQERLAWEAGWPFTPEEAKQLNALKAQQQRAKGAGKGDTAATNELDRQIGELVARRRARGVVAINTQLLQEAVSVGRDSSPPFVIHRPTTRSGQRLVERRIAEMIAADTGLQLQPSGPGVTMLSIDTKAFDASVIGPLRGDR